MSKPGSRNGINLLVCLLSVCAFAVMETSFIANGQNSDTLAGAGKDLAHHGPQQHGRRSKKSRQSKTSCLLKKSRRNLLLKRSQRRKRSPLVRRGFLWKTRRYNHRKVASQAMWSSSWRAVKRVDALEIGDHLQVGNGKVCYNFRLHPRAVMQLI